MSHVILHPSSSLFERLFMSKYAEETDFAFSLNITFAYTACPSTFTLAKLFLHCVNIIII